VREIDPHARHQLGGENAVTQTQLLDICLFFLGLEERALSKADPTSPAGLAACMNITGTGMRR